MMHCERRSPDHRNLPMTPRSEQDRAWEGVSSVRAQYLRFASAIAAVVTLVTVGGAGWKFSFAARERAHERGTHAPADRATRWQRGGRHARASHRSRTQVLTHVRWGPSLTWTPCAHAFLSPTPHEAWSHGATCNGAAVLPHDGLRRRVVAACCRDR